MARPHALLLLLLAWLLAGPVPRPAAADGVAGPIVQTIYYYSPPPPSTPPGTGMPSTAAAPPPACDCTKQPAPPQCNCAPRPPPGPAGSRSRSPPNYAFISGSGGTSAAVSGIWMPLLAAAAAALAWRY